MFEGLLEDNVYEGQRRTKELTRYKENEKEDERITRMEEERKGRYGFAWYFYLFIYLD